MNRQRSERAEGIIHALIVMRGLSYADAIRECERRAEEAAAPYREVAAELRETLRKSSS